MPHHVTARLRLRMPALMLATPLVLLAAACGGTSAGTGTSSSGGGGAAPASGGQLQLTAQNFAFQPSTLHVEPGSSVTVSVTNRDSTAHTFTAPDVMVDQVVQAGATEQVTFTAPASGSVSFHCRFHSQMTGQVVVGAGGAAVTATPSPSGSGGYGY